MGDSLNKVKIAYDNLVLKQENYAKLIEDDAEFQVEEEWMGQCQEAFMALEMEAKIYLESLVSKGKKLLEHSSEVTEGKSTSENECGNK